jgi:large conductance mechanosensitive channel
VTSLVADVIMPLIGVLTGGLNFTDYKAILRPGVIASEGVTAIPPLTLNYGTFLQVVIDFLIVAFCIFMVIKAMNKIKKKEEKPAET